jgi:hypothetical protein
VCRVIAGEIVVEQDVGRDLVVSMSQSVIARLY